MPNASKHAGVAAEQPARSSLAIGASMAWFRRRVRYSLRTLFVVMTLLGAWLAWNVHQVGQRRALVAESGVSAVVVDHDRYLVPGELAGRRVPWVWRLLGAPRVDVIYLHSDKFDQRDLAYYRRMFPEASVRMFPSEPSVGPP